MKKTPKSQLSAGRRLKMALVELGMKGSVLCTELGIGRPTLSHWIAGTRKPTDEQARILEKRFGIPGKAWGEAA